MQLSPKYHSNITLISSISSNYQSLIRNPRGGRHEKGSSPQGVSGRGLAVGGHRQGAPVGELRQWAPARQGAGELRQGASAEGAPARKGASAGGAPTRKGAPAAGSAGAGDAGGRRGDGGGDGDAQLGEAPVRERAGGGGARRRRAGVGAREAPVGEARRGRCGMRRWGRLGGGGDGGPALAHGMARWGRSGGEARRWRLGTGGAAAGRRRAGGGGGWGCARGCPDAGVSGGSVVDACGPIQIGSK